MAIRPPTYATKARVSRDDGTGEFVPVFDVDCNIALGEGVTITQGTTEEFVSATLLVRALLPAGTDVREGFEGVPGDFLECPPDTGRFYQVLCVLDAGAGFPNEHRVALCSKVPPWPAPLPPVYVPPVARRAAVERPVGNGLFNA